MKKVIGKYLFELSPKETFILSLHTLLPIILIWCYYFYVDNMSYLIIPIMFTVVGGVVIVRFFPLYWSVK